MLVLIDYGMGNLRSVEKAFRKLGCEIKPSSSARDVEDASALVLPGVGAFPDCVKNLERFGLVTPLLNAIKAGKPFLGICLGFQVLFEESEEFGPCPGLAVFAGKVKRFSDHMPDPGSKNGAFLKVPHMGWNAVKLRKNHPALEGILSGSFFYFLHSFYVSPADPDLVATETNYGIDFASAIAKDNVIATQFHPEKSQQKGLKLLDNFAKMAGAK